MEDGDINIGGKSMSKKKAYDLYVDQGEDYEKKFQWCLGDGVTPKDITGFIGRCQFRSTAQSTVISLTATVSIDIAVEGKFSLTFSAASSSAIPTDGSGYNDVTRYSYDIEMVSATGKVFRVLNGYVWVSPEITK